MYGMANPHRSFLAHRFHVMLNAAQHRTEIEFGIVKETQQQLHRAVARSPSKTGNARVQHVGAENDRLDGVGERELHVVVGVNPDGLLGRPGELEELVHQRLDLFAVERAETVDDIERRRLVSCTRISSALSSSRSGTVETAMMLIVVSWPLSWASLIMSNAVGI
jgi:hypothetical protein